MLPSHSFLLPQRWLHSSLWWLKSSLGNVHLHKMLMGTQMKVVEMVYREESISLLPC